MFARPAAGICNSENETVNYFSSKVSKLSRCSLSTAAVLLRPSAPGGLANTGRKTIVRDGQGLIFAGCNP